MRAAISQDRLDRERLGRESMSAVPRQHTHGRATDSHEPRPIDSHEPRPPVNLYGHARSAPPSAPRRGGHGDPDPDPDGSDDEPRRNDRDRRRRDRSVRSRRRLASSDTESDGDRSYRFRAEDIGFFDPHLNEAEYGPGDIVDKGGKTYFRSIHLFIDAAKDCARINSATVVRQQLSKCLRGQASVWFMH